MMIELRSAVCQIATRSFLHRGLCGKLTWKEAVGWDRSCLPHMLWVSLTRRQRPLKAPGEEDVLRKAVWLCCASSGRAGEILPLSDRKRQTDAGC